MSSYLEINFRVIMSEKASVTIISKCFNNMYTGNFVDKQENSV